MLGGCVSYRRCRFTAVAAAVIPAALFTIGYAPAAKALPSYARQTGQPCGTCHTDFAGLTPYGRLFKIQGYTAGGGAYRSALFPNGNDFGSHPYIPPLLAKSIAVENAANAAASTDEKPYAPPLSIMTVVGFTNTQAPIPQPSAPYNGNNNVALSSVNFMYGGAITDHVGAFAQISYNAQPAGGFGGNPFGQSLTWDNTDIRYADSIRLGSFNVTYGITANNNPTVQDPWNTTPAWAFPYVSSIFGAGFGPTPIIDGAFAQHVASAGAYAFVNDALYLEASVYTTLSPDAQIHLGVDPFGAPGQIDGAAPYWRVAYESHWGNSWLEVGTFGMYANVRPWSAPPTAPGMGVPVTFTTGTFSQTDKYTDLGFDTQYQYQGSNFWVTLRGSYIYEYQKLDASFANGISTNPADVLNEARAYASLAYGNNNRVVLTGQYFTSWGTPDLGFEGGSPNTKGWIAEIAYIPFSMSQAPLWPWFNVRVGLQYTWYTEFNGTGVGASANNTLFLYVWAAM
jgi:hypothetical protein